MGELALRKLQAALETFAGTAVLADRKAYGTLEPKRDQPRRYAMEERGVLVSNFRANARLVDASFVYKGDVLFEDYPFYLEIMNKGFVTPAGSAGIGYTYDYSPSIDPAGLAANPLRSLTIEWGDESIQWQGPFAQADEMKVEMGTDEPITFELNGFVQEWWPTGRNSFLGFSGQDGSVPASAGAIASDPMDEHAVEAPNGWQIRLFIDKFDPFASPITNNLRIGTTRVRSRYIKASAVYKNQNKRKYFGDFAPFYQKIGRGRRDVELALTLEELSSSDFGDYTNLKELGDMIDTNQPNFVVPQSRVRLQAVGSQIGSTTFGSTAGKMYKSGTKISDLAGAQVGATVTALTIDAVAVGADTFTIPAGSTLRIGPGANGNSVVVQLSAALHNADVSAAVVSVVVPALSDEAPVTILEYGGVPTNALSADVPMGAALVLGDHGQVVTALVPDYSDNDSADIGDTVIPIQPFAPRQDIASAANIYRAKSIEWDFYGALEGDVKWAAHETNVAYDLSLKGVYDIQDGKQDGIFVTNGQATVKASDLSSIEGVF